jgi:hypothetical protein
MADGFFFSNKATLTVELEFFKPPKKKNPKNLHNKNELFFNFRERGSLLLQFLAFLSS